MNKYVIFPCILFFTFFFAGCEKDAQESDLGNGGGEPVPLNIVIGESEVFEDASIPETRSSEAVQTFIQPLDSTQDTGISVITTIETVSSKKAVKTRAALNNGAIFSMYIYNSAGEKIIDNRYKINGTTVTLVYGTAPILTPGTYKFVCTTTNTFKLNVSDIALVANKQSFATYCTTKNISNTDNTLTIAFKWQVSQLQLAVSASGFTDNTATYGSGVVDNLPYQGLWNLNANSSDDNGYEFSDDNTYITCNENIEYHVLPVSRTLSITLNNLTIGGTSYGTKTISVPVSFVKGKSYKMTMQFSRDNSITAAGIRWSPGNLIKNGDEYYFAQNQAEYGTYFTAPIIDDPCKKVLPLDTWRMPTEADFRTLINSGLKFRKPDGFVLGSLILTAQGMKNPETGNVTQEGSCTAYWTIDNIDGRNISFIGFSDNSMLLDRYLFNTGGIRCVKR